MPDLEGHLLGIREHISSKPLIKGIFGELGWSCCGAVGCIAFRFYSDFFKVAKPNCSNLSNSGLEFGGHACKPNPEHH